MKTKKDVLSRYVKSQNLRQAEMRKGLSLKKYIYIACLEYCYSIALVSKKSSRFIKATFLTHKTNKGEDKDLKAKMLALQYIRNDPYRITFQPAGLHLINVQ